MKLAGKVAIVADGVVVQIRNLGPVAVEVKPGRALPLVETWPALAPGETYGHPEYRIEAERVVACHSILAAPRRLVPKSLIVDRLEAAGHLAAARAAFDAAPLHLREKWNARNAVYADDPATVALLTAINADASEILT